jgi:Mg-chelatase subunit ChlD
VAKITMARTCSLCISHKNPAAAFFTRIMSHSYTPHIVAMPPPSAPFDSGTNAAEGFHRSAPMENSEVPETLLSDASFLALEQQGYTKGLIESLIQNKRVFTESIWIIDNSGSMSAMDGHRLVGTKDRKQVKLVQCTRWKELQETVEYHAQLAALIQRPAQFRLLNDPGRNVGPQQFSVAEIANEACIREDLDVARSVLQHTTPSGVTPLTRHLEQVLDHVQSLQATLIRTGTKVVLVICSDGIPTDDQGYTGPDIKSHFVNTLRKFQGLSIWIVVRLCTDEDAVVQFWNGLDSELEMSLEVLDDFMAEATEVHQYNPWLNYALPLHRMRELGFYSKLFDLLDERKLTMDEIQDFCRIVFGEETMQSLPDPEFDFKEFLSQLAIINSKGEQWNPVTKRLESWVNIRVLKKIYGGGSWLPFW